MYKIIAANAMLVFSSWLFAVDAVETACAGTLATTPANYSVADVDYVKYFLCTTRLDPKARNAAWGVNGVNSTITREYQNAVSSSISVNTITNTFITTYAFDDTKNEGMVFLGGDYAPNNASLADEPVFAAIVPFIATASDPVYYELFITKYYTTSTAGGGFREYHQFRMSDPGLVLSADVAGSGTRALMVPLGSQSEFSSFTQAVDGSFGTFRSVVHCKKGVPAVFEPVTPCTN